MKLVQSDVIFDQQAHTYTTPDGVCLQGITGMLGRQLFPDKYSEVPEEVLRKAAERGSLIHEICELVDDLGISHDSEEARNYLRIKEENGLTYEASEYLVSDNEHFASCIDKVYRDSDTEFSLADIKTTYQLDEEYVRWQLSIYACLFEMQNPEAKVSHLYAIWLRGNQSKLVEVERIKEGIIIDLLSSEINGQKFVNPLKKPKADNNLPEQYREMEQSIIEIDRQEKYWKEQKELLMDGVMKEMVKAGVYSWKGDSISFTRRKEGTRKAFDRESFDRDYPGVYEKYITEIPTSGSVTLKVL